MSRLFVVLAVGVFTLIGGKAMELTSTAFKDQRAIPAGHSYRGGNVSPPLTISGVPAGTVSLALICDDPDAPGGTWVHWVVWNIDPNTTQIPKGGLPAGAVVGGNSWGKTEWGGPAPPSGTHHYVFKLYALKETVSLKPGAHAKALEAAIKGKIWVRPSWSVSIQPHVDHDRVTTACRTILFSPCRQSQV